MHLHLVLNRSKALKICTSRIIRVIKNLGVHHRIVTSNNKECIIKTVKAT